MKCSSILENNAIQFLARFSRCLPEEPCDAWTGDRLDTELWAPRTTPKEEDEEEVELVVLVLLDRRVVLRVLGPLLTPSTPESVDVASVERADELEDEDELEDSWNRVL